MAKLGMNSVVDSKGAKINERQKCIMEKQAMNFNQHQEKRSAIASKNRAMFKRKDDLRKL